MSAQNLQTAFDFDAINTEIANEVVVTDITESANTEIADSLPSPTVYEYLTQQGILRKVTDIALHKGNVPEHLRDDARQCIHIKWSQYRVNLTYSHSQICSYAVGMARDEVLRVRREMGAVVELPSAIFKAQNAGNCTVQALGAFVNPMSVEDYADSIEYSTTDDYMPTSVSAEQVRARLRTMTLTSTQRRVVEMVCTLGLSIEEVAQQLSLTTAYVERLVSTAIQAIHDYDDRMAA